MIGRAIALRGDVAMYHNNLGNALRGLGERERAAVAYERAVARCVEALHAPGAVDGRCMSPAGFEWSIGEAVAGTAMDQLVHTWDLAVAIGGDRKLDAELVEACVDMFLPQMPDIGAAQMEPQKVPI